MNDQQIEWYIEKDNPITPERPYKTTSIDRARTPQEIGRELKSRVRDLRYTFQGRDEEFVDEYISTYDDKESPPLPSGVVWRRLIVYPVTGANEGFYIHVDGIPDSREEKSRPIALVKTFRYWEDAWAMAEEIAGLLGV
jgi:hypothetical protein